MPSTLLVSPAPDTYTKSQTEENMIRQAWHSFEEALHLREPVPPPVPPKDEKWLIRTVNLAIPQEETDSSLWDSIVQRISAMHAHAEDEDEQDAVSISIPAEAALRQLGVDGNDSDMQDKRNYFKRMAGRCKEKFDEDSARSNNGSLSHLSSSSPDKDDDDAPDDDESLENLESSRHRRRHQLRQYFHAVHRHPHPHHTERQLLEATRTAQFIPKVDPKEMKAAHRSIYRQRRDHTSEEDDEEDRKLFGSWWGWKRSSRRKDGKLVEEELDSEWEKIDSPKSKEEKRQSLGEHNGDPTGNVLATMDTKSIWWKRKPFEVEAVSHDRGELSHDRRATVKRHQAIAAAAAYEAVKEYHARKIRQGKKVSHGEMKAILAGMAMAEAVKLLESRRGDENSDEERDETVAEAGSSALKLFELLR